LTVADDVSDVLCSLDTSTVCSFSMDGSIHDITNRYLRQGGYVFTWRLSVCLSVR